MDALSGFMNHWLSQSELEKIIGSGIKVLMTLVLALIIFKLLRRALKRFEARLMAADEDLPDGTPSEHDKRIQTLVRLFRQAASIAIWVVVGLMILAEIGIDMRPILAGAGIVGVAVGFGAQNLVRDIISGFFMIMENQIRVGDTVVINGTSGVVEQINMRTVVLRDVGDVVHIFPNGLITTLANQTKGVSAYVFDVGVAYKEDTDTVTNVISGILDGIVDDPEFGPKLNGKPEIFGVSRLGESSVEIRGRIRTLPGNQWAVGREFLKRVKREFARQNIQIPFPHRTLMLADSAISPVAEKILKDRVADPDPKD